MVPIIKQVLPNVVFELQREIRKIGEHRRRRVCLRLPLNGGGLGLRRPALLLHNVSQFVRHQFPPATRVRRELSRAKDNIPPNRKRSRLH
jgi:hypothetical protein